jgi:hypothetical protein
MLVSCTDPVVQYFSIRVQKGHRHTIFAIANSVCNFPKVTQLQLWPVKFFPLDEHFAFSFLFKCISSVPSDYNISFFLRNLPFLFNPLLIMALY